MDFPTYGLYAITDGKQGAPLITAVAAALEGGVRIVQYRDKTQDTKQRFADAAALQALCEEYAVPLIINDDVELAVKVGAAGVHLGQKDTKLAQARAVLGDKAIIGASCHNSLEFAEIAQRNGATYVAFGTCYPSPSKPLAPRTPLTIFRKAQQKIKIPIVAIGGITTQNAPEVLAAGASILAVITGLFNATDIKQEAIHFSQLIKEYSL